MFEEQLPSDRIASSSLKDRLQLCAQGPSLSTLRFVNAVGCYPGNNLRLQGQSAEAEVTLAGHSEICEDCDAGDLGREMSPVLKSCGERIGSLSGKIFSLEAGRPSG